MLQKKSLDVLVNLHLETRGFRFLWFDNRYTLYYDDKNNEVSPAELYDYFFNLKATGFLVKHTRESFLASDVPPSGIVTDIDDEYVYIEYELQSYNVKRENFLAWYTLNLNGTSY